MKLSDDFDARRLRPRQPRSWRLRIGAALGALLAAFGILLAMAEMCIRDRHWSE